MSLVDLTNLISNHISMRLRSIPKQLADDIYAFSLYMDKGDIEQPLLTFSFNTKSQVAYVMAREDSTNGKPSDENEAKWNYAFWLQKPNSSFLSPPDGEDGILWQLICKQLGLEYSEEDDFDIDEYEESISKLLAELAVSVALHLHSSGIFFEKFNKILPVIIHELEYYDEIASITESGNPENIADDFIEWVTNV